MSNVSLRRSFALFHLTLAIVIFWQSVRTVAAGLSSSQHSLFGSHLVLVAGLEALGALLFLLPRTLRIGGILLLLVFAIAIFLHGIQHELTLIVYAAAVLFVMVHGNAFSRDLIRLRSA